MVPPMDTSFEPTRHTTSTRALVVSNVCFLVSGGTDTIPGGLVLASTTKSMPAEPTEDSDIADTEMDF